MEQKQDLRIRKTYLALTKTLLQMLEEMPFEQVTVNELCNRAMVRRATFYKHFADKYEFFTFVVREIQQEFSERNAPDAAEPKFFYRNTIQAIFDFVDENRVLVASIMKSNAFPVLLDMVSEQTARSVREKLEQDVRAGAEFPGSPVILAQLFTGALISTVKWWVTEKERIPKEQIVEQVATLLLRDLD